MEVTLGRGLPGGVDRLYQGGECRLIGIWHEKAACHARGQRGTGYSHMHHVGDVRSTRLPRLSYHQTRPSLLFSYASRVSRQLGGERQELPPLHVRLQDFGYAETLIFGQTKLMLTRLTSGV